MNFKSILFKIDEGFGDTHSEPDFFEDLNLNIVIDKIVEDKKEYELKPFFYFNLKNLENIKYRQEILKDIEKEDVFKTLKSFASSMSSIRQGLQKAKKMSCRYQKERWFLDSVNVYCSAVSTLLESLAVSNTHSEGLKSFYEYLKAYSASNEFKELCRHTRQLKEDLNGITYSLFIKENRIRVERYKGEEDYAEKILKVFERFRQNEIEDYEPEFHELEHMNHVESGILQFVAKLYSGIFEDLDAYCSKYSDFLDMTIRKFDREVQFYISYLEYIDPVKKLGLAFCYPEVSKTKENMRSFAGFDLAVATKLAKDNKKAVSNDYYMDNKERIFIITGPNQGGKTTFARAFGQMHYLASLGLEIPGSMAKLFHFDSIFTHFEKEENITTLSGKLENDLVRIRDILNKATSESIIIMNEIFSSTSLHDAVFLGRQVLSKIIEMDAFCVFVTFMDELASLNEKIVSMVAAVRQDDVTIRTYKIERRKADGVSYAVSIADKYCLTYKCLSERLRRIEQ